MLQVYGQSVPHNDVFVVGDRESLIRLRQTIDRALSGHHARMEAQPSDSELYHIYVMNTNDITIKNLSSHYSDSDFSSIPGRKDLYSTFYTEMRSYLPVTESRR